MLVYSLISQKGGTGKSTLALHLAVLAGEDGPSYVVDRDPSGTCRRWLDRRGEEEGAPKRPTLLNIGAATLAQAVSQLRAVDGSLFVDTRPAVPDLEAARVADVVLVPVRPSPDDLKALPDTLAMLRRLSITPLIIINAAPSYGRAIETRAALSQHGLRVCPHHLADRAAYLDASLQGRSFHEMSAASLAATELRQVWTWIKETVVANERPVTNIIDKSAATEPDLVANTLPPSAGDDRPLLASINTYVVKQDRHRLNQLALDDDTSVQKLVHKAISTMLQDRGLPPLEPATANTPSGLRRRR